MKKKLRVVPLTYALMKHCASAWEGRKKKKMFETELRRKIMGDMKYYYQLCDILPKGKYYFSISIEQIYIRKNWCDNH